MDAFIDYLYYVSKGGTSIPESEFTHFALRASYRVEYLTVNRAERIILADTNDDLIERIKLATMAVAEILQEYAGYRARQGIQSEKVGDHSVQYADGAAVTEMESHAVRTAVESYLGLTGLMYAGVW